ncbi:MFS general substrate transporter [Nadsonia fulvescens var. elongata DSM 6958]|uniref:MFS general substrate transporter n=1 Tax=Nadsonia fulvescens var. elongata DSM 6958 TaxID=857566 RepID=A0A1E3PNC2_9ASCO|nr:MFS general substrate transporter [Nadsonia fulvescens var. elongata DSM 6958]
MPEQTASTVVSAIESSYGLVRSLSLLSCFFIGLASGTLYLYSTFGPQLGQRLHLTTQQTSLLGMIGNLGMSLSGPLTGAVVDRHGPKLPVLVSSILLFMGYRIVIGLYESEHLGNNCFGLVSIGLALIGVGSNLGFASAVRCAATNFPKRMGAATAVPLAAFGLSALFFSAWASIVYPGNTTGFLRMLSWAPAGALVICALAINTKPTEIELKDEKNDVVADDTEFTIMGLFRDSNFKSYFIIMGLLAGIGQMYIYSCGIIIRSLAIGEYIEKTTWQSFDPKFVATIDTTASQSLQVGLISLFSFAGRVFGGIFGDYVTLTLQHSRTWLLVIVAGLCCLTQILAVFVVNSLQGMSVLSALSGLFYGICFGTYPTLVSDNFGAKHFSKNWGLISLSPVPFGYFLNWLFGFILDGKIILQRQFLSSLRYSSTEEGAMAWGDSDNDNYDEFSDICLLGKNCYKNAFVYTLVISLFIIYKVLQVLPRGNISSLRVKTPRKHQS